MRRAVLATGTTVAGVVLLLSLKPHQTPAATSASAPQATSSAGAGSRAAPSAGATATGTAPRSGTYKGRVIGTRYGPVQVEITISVGRLTAVRVLQVPSENGRDREINAFAVPQLTQEALAAGNARIDAVSGATYTSEGYITSLQSALDTAGA